MLLSFSPDDEIDVTETQVDEAKDEDEFRQKQDEDGFRQRQDEEEEQDGGVEGGKTVPAHTDIVLLAKSFLQKVWPGGRKNNHRGGGRFIYSWG